MTAQPDVPFAILYLLAQVERERATAVAQLRHAERLNVIGALAASVVHELGTPLNVISSCADLLEREQPTEATTRRTNVIHDQLSKISTIVRRLLDFGHRGEPGRALVDLAEIACSTVDMMRSTANRRDVRLTFEAHAHVRVVANGPELSQVCSNLILNAVQAGGTRVCVRSGEVEREEKRFAFVEVEDDGCGIAPEDLERIFEPFYTTKGVGEGTGLGLSVSFEIVTDHGGWIDVTSEHGRGSRFTVLLPDTRSDHGTS